MGAEMPATLLTVRGSYHHAWEQLRRSWARLLLLVLVGGLLPAGVAMLLLVLGQVAEAGGAVALGPVFVVLANVYVWLVLVPLTYGWSYAILRVARGEPPRVADAFAVFGRAYLPSLGAFVLVLAQIAAGMLLIVPGIRAQARLAFVPFLVVDEGLGAKAAIRESWRRSAGHGRTILGVSLLGAPLLLAGLLLGLVGMVPTLLWTMLALASLYAAITTRLARPVPVPPVSPP
ncbi:MAG: hypothetical protein HY332_11285 [Chloroflexi bacterium]|nr:hypothetical protein [Chloroflexota bacterium]